MTPTGRSHLGPPLAILLSAAAFGCGLLDLPSFGDIVFQLPKRSYTMSTDDPRWKQPPPQGVPDLTCGPGGLVADCCRPPAPAGPIDCGVYPLACLEGEQVCALKFAYEQVQMIDLGQVPALKQFQGRVLSEMALTRIEVAVDNQLNLAVPPMDLFIGAAELTSSDGAHYLATIPTTAPGQHTHEVELTPEAQQVFSEFARDFQTPFNFIVSATMVVRGNTPTPQGMLKITVGGQVSAKL